jgi:2-polyprenyl-3-methyl-5-hydroxy-6-metoxy-1,4-benzoquinol methylase
MEKFCQVDLENVRTLDVLENQGYDIVVMVHVIEHLSNGQDVIKALCEKVKVGGGIYIEFPSVESLALPSMEGTLNFCDDPTHVYVHDVREISNLLMEQGYTINYAGRRRHPLLFVLSPLLILLGVLKNRKVTAFGFWDLFHFADCIYAVKSRDTSEIV